MAAVIFLASGTWELQAAIGASYVLLNGIYSLVGLEIIPSRFDWDMRAVEVFEDPYEQNLEQIQALIRVIQRVHSTQWMRCKRKNVVPETVLWSRWMDEADRNLDDHNWDGIYPYDVLRHQFPLGWDRPTSGATPSPALSRPERGLVSEEWPPRLIP